MGCALSATDVVRAQAVQAPSGVLETCLDTLSHDQQLQDHICAECALFLHCCCAQAVLSTACIHSHAWSASVSSKLRWACTGCLVCSGNRLLLKLGTLVLRPLLAPSTPQARMIKALVLTTTLAQERNCVFNTACYTCAGHARHAHAYPNTSQDSQQYLVRYVVKGLKENQPPIAAKGSAGLATPARALCHSAAMLDHSPTQVKLAGNISRGTTVRQNNSSSWCVCATP
jgi:hypothetical protein